MSGPQFRPTSFGRGFQKRHAPDCSATDRMVCRDDSRSIGDHFDTDRRTGLGELLRKIESADFVAIGAPAAFETTLALSNKLQSDAFPMVEAWIRRSDGNVSPFTRERIHAAIDGFRRFGRGRRKRKRNLGDSMTYAVAGMPLLFTGDDFIHTDRERA